MLDFSVPLFYITITVINLFYTKEKKMKQSLDATPEMQQKLQHKLSMQLMEIGQTILELEDSYMQCLSRQMQEKVHSAADNVLEVAKSMTDITAERMVNWKKEKPDRRFKRSSEAWEKMSGDQKSKWDHEVSRMMKNGFCNFYTHK